MGIIDIDKTLVPYQFEINLNNKIYTLVFNYNVSFDFFTVDLILNGVTLVKGEKLVLDQFLFKEVSRDADGNLNPDFPAEILFVSTSDDSITRVGYDNLGSTVFLYYAEQEEVSV